MSQHPILVLEFQGRPGELPVFSLHWHPEELGSNTSKGMPQEQNRQTWQSKRGQTDKKQMLPSSVSFCVDCHQAWLRWSSQENPSRVCLVAWILVDYRYNQVDKEDYPSQAHILSTWPTITFPYIKLNFQMKTITRSQFHLTLYNDPTDNCKCLI